MLQGDPRIIGAALDDGARILQFCERGRDTCAANTQNHRQLITSKRDRLFVQAIRCEKQPSTQALLELVAHIAQRGLGILNEKRMNVIEQMLAHRWCMQRVHQNIAKMTKAEKAAISENAP